VITVWAYSNLHGDNIITTDGAGTRTGQRAGYDAFGDPIEPATANVGIVTANKSGPDTDPSTFADAGWEGSHQKLLQTAGDISAMSAEAFGLGCVVTAIAIAGHIIETNAAIEAVVNGKRVSPAISQAIRDPSKWPDALLSAFLPH
jgi:hypothetical protein